jgi:hypothetical protein
MDTGASNSILNQSVVVPVHRFETIKGEKPDTLLVLITQFIFDGKVLPGKFCGFVAIGCVRILPYESATVKDDNCKFDEPNTLLDENLNAFDEACCD